MLFGRDDELAKLDAALARAQDGQGGAVLLTGPPGMGKTALGEALADRARRAGFEVFAGRAWPTDAGLAFAPILEALGGPLRALPRAELTPLVTGLDDLERLFPDLSLPMPPAMGDPVLERTRLFEAVAGLLARIAAQRPLLLWLDDLHATDPGTVDLLAYAVRRLARARALVVLAYRDTGTPAEAALTRLEHAMDRAGLGGAVSVGPLDRAALGALAAHILGGTVAEPVLDLLSERTLGAPLFAEALLGLLRARDALLRVDGRWHLAGAVTAVPAAVEALYREALDGMPPDARVVLETVAVAGDPAPWPLLDSVCGLPGDAVGRALAHLQATGWIAEEAGVEVTWHVVHPLAQEVVANGLSELRRRRLHRSWLEGIEAVSPEDLARLARHYRGAGTDLPDPTRAVDVLYRAAGQARSQLAHDDAARCLAAALALVRLGVGGGTRVALLCELGEAWLAVGERAAAVEAWIEAVGLLQAGGRIEEAGALRARLALALWDLGRLDDARRTLEDGLLSLDEIGPSASMAALAHAAARIYHRYGDRDRSARAFRAVASWTAVPPQMACEVATVTALAALAQGRLDDGVEALRDAERLVASPAQHRVVSEVLLVLAVTVALPDRWEILERCEAADRRFGLAGLRVSVPTMRAGMCLVEGQVDAAASELGPVLAMVERLGAPRHAATTMALLAAVRTQQNRLDEAEAWLARAREAAAGFEADRHLGGDLLLSALMVALARLDAEAASAHADAMGGDEVVPALNHAVYRCRAYLVAGRVGDAAAVAATVDAGGSKVPAVGATARHLGALVAVGQGDPGAADQLLDAVGRLDQCGLRGDACVARLVYAEATEGPTALREARAAYETVESLGMTLYVDRARAALRALGASAPTRRSPRGKGGLSPRELEVAQLAAKGLTSTEIGHVLFISPQTVSTHIKRIYARIEVSSRAELTTWMIAQGHHA